MEALDRFLKRFFDVGLGIILLVLLTPLLLLIALCVWIMMARPVIFCQKRPGYKARLFTLYKFRTMKTGREGMADPRTDAGRLTTLGRFLRTTSLDELPELFNVIKGDMSFVGPRPLLEQYLSRYSPEQARRHDVRPGITGWAQVNGRNALTWEEKFKLDVWYVDHRSIVLDAKIVFLTVLKIITCAGINRPGSATAEEFTGTRERTEP